MTAPVLIVGGGPAGMSAALWLRDLEVGFDWIEADSQLGGTLRRVGNPIKNLVGTPVIPGTDLAGRLAEDCIERGLTCRTDAATGPFARDGDGTWRTELASGDAWSGSAVLLCTGTRPRFLGLDAERTHLGRGVEISVTRNLPRYAGVPCVVVGGGDAALEGALLLSDVSPAVHIVHRSNTFRAQPRFVERATEAPNIHFHLCTNVGRIHTDADTVTGATLADGTVLACRGVFVRIGVAPVVPEGLEACAGPDGYIVTDARGRTNVPGVYAAGDAASRDHQSVSWALGSAGRAARAIHDDLLDATAGR